jgi:hypothetical protein
MKNIPRRDLAGVERLATACATNRAPQVEIWPSFGRRRQRYKVEIIPLPPGRVALCFASPSFDGLAPCDHPTDSAEADAHAEQTYPPAQLTLW